MSSLRPVTFHFKKSDSLNAEVPEQHTVSWHEQTQAVWHGVSSVEQAEEEKAKIEADNPVYLGEVPAVCWFGSAAEQGSASAMYSLAVCFNEGIGTRADYSLAVQWYRRAAEAGDVRAQFWTAEYFWDNDNIRESLNWYRKAAEQGHVEALRKLIEILLGEYNDVEPDIINKEESIALLLKWVKQGDCWAQLKLAKCFKKGNGVGKDEKQALFWYQEAAEQGDPETQYRLAGDLEYGHDVPEDEKEALVWYRRAAQQGHYYAQCSLVRLLEDETNPSQDEKEARHWRQELAKNGDSDSQLMLADWLENGIGVEKDLEAAARWYRELAKKSFSKAQFKLIVWLKNGTIRANDEKEMTYWFQELTKLAQEERADKGSFYLAVCFEQGIATQKDEEQALNYYLKAAKNGNPDALLPLIRCFEHGVGTEENQKEAMRWCRVAAERGLADAQFIFATYLENNNIVMDGKDAEHWYREAATQGHTDAQFNLGLYLLKNKTAPKLIEEGVKLIQQAAAKGHQGAQDMLPILEKRQIGVAQNPEHPPASGVSAAFFQKPPRNVRLRKNIKFGTLSCSFTPG